MKKILITWVRNRDPYDNNNNNGPILSVLHNERFDSIELFTTDELITKSKNLTQELNNMKIKIDVSQTIIKLTDPRDYTEIFITVKEKLKLILEKYQNKSNLYVYLDPGTPQMKTAWIMLKLAGYLPASLIQGTEPQFNKGRFKTTEIHLDSLSFPGLELKHTKQVNIALKRYEKNKKDLLDNFKDIIGEHPEILKKYEMAYNIAPYDESVLITGESGTGKELIARKIHALSKRNNEKFVSINCAAIPESIFESELFGYKKGAFTGANADKNGLISESHKGTLFLDEIGEMPIFIQAKLLRTLQDKIITRIGDTNENKVDFRLLCATNKDLKTLINKGLFREDLYHRINVVEIKIPPLRERRSDIVLLIKYFLEKYNTEYNTNKELSELIKEKMLSYSWPGNVRELENIIKRLLLISEEKIVSNVNLLPDISKEPRDYFKDYLEFSDNNPRKGFDEYINMLQAEIFRKTLKNFEGNATKTAEYLNIKPHTFRAMLKRFEKQGYKLL